MMIFFKFIIKSIGFLILIIHVGNKGIIIEMANNLEIIRIYRGTYTPGISKINFKMHLQNLLLPTKEESTPLFRDLSLLLSPGIVGLEDSSFFCLRPRLLL